MELVKAQTYLDNFDISLVKKLERLVSIFPTSKKIDTAKKLINIYQRSSKVSYYFLALLNPSFKENDFTKEVLATISYGKGDLFCDYLLMKHMYYTYGGYSEPILEEIKKALKKLVDQNVSIEAKYLYYDLLILEGYRSTEVDAIKGFLNLAKNGHPYAAMSVAFIFISSPDEYPQYANSIIPFLNFAASCGLKHAQRILIDILNNGLDNRIPRDPENAKRYEELFNETTYDGVITLAEQYYREGMYFPLSNDEALKLFPLARKLKRETNHYALSLYRKYIEEKEKKIDYTQSLNLAYKELYKVYPRADYNTIIAIANIIFNEKKYQDKDLGFKLLFQAYEIYPNPDLAYVLYKLIKLDDSFSNYKKYIPHLAEVCLNKYAKLDFEVFLDLYFAKCGPKDKYRYAKKLLKWGVHLEPEFAKAEYAYILLKEGKTLDAKEIFQECKNYIDALRFPYTFAKLYENLGKDTQEKLKSIDFYKAAAACGDEKSSYKLAKYYENGILVDKNLDEACTFYLLAATQGVHNGYFKAAYIMLESGKEQEGFDTLLKGASLSNKACENALGDMYFYGRFVDKDFHKAAYWYSEGAKDKDPRCMFKLGIIFREGLGYKKDIEKAYKLFNLSTKFGYKRGMFKLYGKYFYDVDTEKGINYLNKAYVSEEDSESAYLLGSLLESKREVSEAKRYYKIAAKDNNKDALFELGQKEHNLRKKIKYFEDSYLFGNSSSISYAGIYAYKAGNFQKAYRYLSNGLSDEIPETYYYMGQLHLNKRIPNAKEKDGYYYIEKSAKLGYPKAVRFLKGA